MDWTTLLFSFNGRINRGKCWLVAVVYLVILIVFMAAMFAWFGFFTMAALFRWENVDAAIGIAGASLAFWTIWTILVIAGTWSTFAIAIKRLHDRDKSGWWIVPFYFVPNLLGSMTSFVMILMGMEATSAYFIPLAAGALIASGIIAVWAFVEIACLPGTPGPNRYGPDPLGNPLIAIRR
jgi:uncharacterized membrane protein YhaH (DUF805 family)